MDVSDIAKNVERKPTCNVRPTTSQKAGYAPAYLKLRKMNTDTLNKTRPKPEK